MRYVSLTCTGAIGRTNGVAQRRAGAVHRQQRHVRRPQPRHGQRGGDEQLLRWPVGRGQAAGPSVLAHRRTLHDRVMVKGPALVSD